MNFVTDRVFERQFKKMPASVREKLAKRLALLSVDEFNQILQNHKLTAPYTTYRSINITSDWRLLYRRASADTLYLRAVGTHHQLYGT